MVTGKKDVKMETNYLNIAIGWCLINAVVTLVGFSLKINMFYLSMYFLIGYFFILFYGFVMELRKMKFRNKLKVNKQNKN